MNTANYSRILFLVTLIIAALALTFGTSDPTACLILCEA